MRSNLSFTTTLALALCALPGWAQQSAAPATTPSPKAIEVSSGVMAGNRIGGASPVYPAIAKAAHIQGTVVLQALISPEGKVENLHVVSGPPMLQAAAVDAVRTWTYRPYLMGGASKILTRNGPVTVPTQGRPVTVVTQINVIFTLGSATPAAAPSAQAVPDTGATDAVPAAAQDQPPAHPVTPEQVHEMLQLTGALGMIKQFADAMMPTIRQEMPPYMPDDVFADFQKSFLGANLEDAITRAYQKHVSTEDAAAAIAFYRTPAGQRILAIQPTLEKELQEQGRQLAVQTMMEVLERHKSEIDNAKKQYEASHLWTPPKN